MTDTGNASSKIRTEFLVLIILAISLNLFLIVFVNYVLMEGNVSHKIHAALMGIISTGAAFNVGVTFYAVKIGARQKLVQPSR
jgi:hypothetical protein